MPDPIIAENYWGTTFPDLGDSAPVALLRQQAEVLGRLTGGKVKGVVQQADVGGTAFASLYLTTPSISDYQFKILYLAQPIIADPRNPFPITVEDSFHSGVKRTVENMGDFERWLKDLLSSEPVRVAIGAMKSRSDG